jgi:hypothetical protein
VFADLSLDWVSKEKVVLNNYGHFSKPEMLWLGRKNTAE